MNPPSTYLIETLKRYALSLWHRAWLVGLLALLGAAGGYLYSRTQPSLYLSGMRVMVVRPVKETSNDLTFWMWNAEVAQNYAQLTQNEGFALKVFQRTGEIGTVSAYAVPETQFLALSVTTPNPKAAVPLLNTGVEVLDEEIRTLQMERYAKVEESLTLQMISIAEQVAQARAALDERYTLLVAEEKLSLEKQIFDLETQLAALRNASASAPEISQTQTRLNAAKQAYLVLLQTNRIPASRDAELTSLEKNLSLYQTLFDKLTTERENIRLLQLQAIPALLKVEEPFEPLEPFLPRTRRNTGLGGLAGLGLGIVLALAVEFLSDTLKSSEEARQRLGQPFLGRIPRHAPHALLPLEQDPQSTDAEAYRILRTNLSFRSVERFMQIILVTSPGETEGKSVVATNLAAAFSQTGSQVLLVDANFRHPCLHQILHLENRLGLSDALLAPENDTSSFLHSYQAEHGVRFSVLTSGRISPVSLDLLGSERATQLLANLTPFFDLIILDASSLFGAEVQMLAAHADGVLLVGQFGRTRFGSLRAALESLGQSRAHLAGLVLTQVLH